MQLDELCRTITEFSVWNHADKIKLFAWYLHTYRQQEFFKPAQIDGCFEELKVAPPSLVGPFLTAMVARRPPEALKSAKGYCLERRIRDAFDAKYGKRASTIHVQKLLSELPSRVPSLAEKAYLEESLTCFSHRAFRAAIVMCWNLAFDHLCEFVLHKHLMAFNAQLPRSFPKADIIAVSKKDDFAELKEAQVLQVCRSAIIITGSMHKILKEKLDRRNIAAHPSGVVVSELTAEEFIKDLLENVVLQLN